MWTKFDLSTTLSKVMLLAFLFILGGLRGYSQDNSMIEDNSTIKNDAQVDDEIENPKKKKYSFKKKFKRKIKKRLKKMRKKARRVADEVRKKRRTKKKRRRRKKRAPFYNVGDGALVLPKGIWRFRSVHTVATSSSGWDEDGKKSDFGGELTLKAKTIGIEYGITKTLSFGLIIPYIYSNKFGLNRKKFVNSELYEENIDEFNDTVAKVLQESGVCTDAATTCIDLINSGYALPNDIPVTLPTGEVLVAKAGIPINQYREHFLVNGAKPTSGKTGIGDITVAVLNKFIDRDGFVFSVGTGVILPTGSAEEVPIAQRGTGNGFLTAGIRLNAEYRIIPAINLSWQNESQYHLTKSKRKRSSQIDSTQLNQADPTNGGDGDSNDQDYTAKTIRNLGYFRIIASPRDLSRKLKGLGFSATYHYDFGHKYSLGGESQGPRPIAFDADVAVNLSLLPYKIPMSMSIDRKIPLSGKNVTLASEVTNISIIFYAKF